MVRKCLMPAVARDWWGVALAQGGFAHVEGIDYSKAMLAEAAKKAVYRRLEQMNMNALLPIDSGTYDGVTCVGTFTSAHVVPDALKELIRVTASRRRCVLHGARGVLARDGVPFHARSIRGIWSSTVACAA